VRYPEAYCALLSAFLAKKLKLFGATALAMARAIPGIAVADDGSVTRIEGDPVAKIEQVLKEFERLSGKVSTINARGIVLQLDLRERYPDIELPASLK